MDTSTQTTSAARPRRLTDSPWAWVLYAAMTVALCGVIAQFCWQTTRKNAQSETKGAIPRWLLAVDPLWRGENIYSRDGVDGSSIQLHPNMPAVPILLTPLAHLPPLATAILIGLLKILLVWMSVRMIWEVTSHGPQRPPLWVLSLGVLWAFLCIVADFQHGNTNTFVLAAIVLHLWLFRRGRDLLAGSALSLAICLKMVPALFVLYWLYQRSWRVLVGVLVGLVVLVIVLPSIALGPTRAMDLTHQWLDNLIIPGLVKNSPYPIHINQSLPAMVNRYFSTPGDPKGNGNIWWNSDDVPVYPGPEELAKIVKIPPNQPQWITLATMEPPTVQMLARLCQVAIVCVLAWAIGLRKLPRDDVRRALHYGLVVIAMMLLNQRTWDEHAAVLLTATVPVWMALGFGRISRPARWTALSLTILAGAVYWLTRQESLRIIAKLFHTHTKPSIWADQAEAYGGAFWLFLLLLIATAILAIAMKKSDPPLASERQRL